MVRVHEAGYRQEEHCILGDRDRLSSGGTCDLERAKSNTLKFDLVESLEIQFHICARCALGHLLEGATVSGRAMISLPFTARAVERIHRAAQRSGLG